MSFTYEYPRPAVTVDCVVFGLDDEGLKILLIKRALEPFRDRWALPGGFVHMQESLEDAAKRELNEESGLKDVFLEQLFTFGDPKRDPRGRVISIAYFALVNIRDHRVKAATDAKDAAWFSVEAVPDTAFDHSRIINTALSRIQGKLRYQPIGFELLPKKFTLSQLQQLYEVILCRPLDKRNFRRKILETNLLVPLDETQKDVAHRAARFYQFDRRKYLALAKSGLNFEI